MKAMYCCRLRLNMRTENVDGTKMSLSSAQSDQSLRLRSMGS